VYWIDIFPPTLLVAIGMTIIVAPLTASVMSSVNQSHVGIASGFNSAVARVGGLFATALVSFVFASQGSAPALLAGFREATLVGATLAAMAAVSSLALVRAQAISRDYKQP